MSSSHAAAEDQALEGSSTPHIDLVLSEYFTVTLYIHARELASGGVTLKKYSMRVACGVATTPSVLVRLACLGLVASRNSLGVTATGAPVCKKSHPRHTFTHIKSSYTSTSNTKADPARGRFRMATYPW